MRCCACGDENAIAGARFCPACGKPLFNTPGASADRPDSAPAKIQLPTEGEARLAERLGTPPTVSQLQQNGQQPDAGGLAWGRFIGRAEEMAALRAAIDASLGGQASLVMVAGEPGIGKTRLAEEAGAYARHRGA